MRDRENDNVKAEQYMNNDKIDAVLVSSLLVCYFITVTGYYENDAELILQLSEHTARKPLVLFCGFSFIVQKQIAKCVKSAVL